VGLVLARLIVCTSLISFFVQTPILPSLPPSLPQLKTVKYIGELVKFKVCPPIVPFTCIKSCLEGFSRHNVEVSLVPPSLLLWCPPIVPFTCIKSCLEGFSRHKR